LSESQKVGLEDVELIIKGANPIIRANTGPIYMKEN